MSPHLSLDPDDPTPPYEQLRRQLADLITAGQLAPGDRLPPLRQLAGDLALAVGTVARTYRELEHDGLLTTSRGGGTRVASPDTPPTTTRRRLLAGMTRDYLDRAHSLGFTDDEIATALRRQLPLQPP